MRTLAIVAAAIAILVCNYAADAQEEKKAAPYAVKAEDCKTAASCRVQCKEPDHFLVSARYSPSA